MLSFVREKERTTECTRRSGEKDSQREKLSMSGLAIFSLRGNPELKDQQKRKKETRKKRVKA